MIGFSPSSPKSAHIKGLTNITYDELIPLLMNVTIGEKDGSFFTRSAFIDPAAGRKTNKSVEPLSEALVSDFDSTINPDTGEITEGAPPEQDVIKVLVDCGWAFIIYRSHSHGLKGPRYRVVFPTDRPYNQAELAPTLDSVFKELHDAGVYARNVPENNNWSLAWYLPRKGVNDMCVFNAEKHEGHAVNVVEAKEIPKDVQNAVNAVKTQRSSALGNGLIRIYNTTHNVVDLLKQRGDIENGYNRFTWSKSASGSPGISIFDTDQGGLVFSHHGDDPLADGEAHDAFDVYRITANKTLTQALAAIDVKAITDFVSTCVDDDILEDINRGLIFTSPQVAARVRKLLKDKLDLTISVLKDEAKYFKKSLEEDEDDEPDSHYAIIQAFLEQFEINPISYAGQILTYNGAVWEAKDIDAYQRLFAEQYGSNPLCKRSSDYVALTKLLYTTCKLEDDFFHDAPHGIACNHQFIGVNEKGKIFREALTHEHKQRIHYDYELDEDTPTEWLENLDKALDTQDEINLLQEIFAATLFGSFPPLKKAALLKGTGDSGKSAIIRILQSFVPPALQSASPPSDWSNKEYIGNIAGKAINSVGEMDATKRMSGNEFKKVIGSDVCEGRKLYIGVFNFTNTAAHIFNANEFPPTTATDPAFFSRWIILEFPNKIAEKDQIKTFAEDLLEKERAKILNWCLAGAIRLTKNQAFTQPANHDKLISTWEASVNPFLAFIQDTHHINIITNPMAQPSNQRVWYSTEQIYKIYELWCRVNGIKSTLAVNKLIQKMKESHLIYRNPNNNYAKLYTGIRISIDFGYTTKVNLFDCDGIYDLDHQGNKI